MAHLARFGRRLTTTSGLLQGLATDPAARGKWQYTFPLKRITSKERRASTLSPSALARRASLPGLPQVRRRLFPDGSDLKCAARWRG